MDSNDGHPRFLLGNTPVEISVLSTVYFTHFEELNFNLQVSKHSIEVFYRRVIKIIRFLDSSTFL